MLVCLGITNWHDKQTGLVAAIATTLRLCSLAYSTISFSAWLPLGPDTNSSPSFHDTPGRRYPLGSKMLISVFWFSASSSTRAIPIVILPLEFCGIWDSNSDTRDEMKLEGVYSSGAWPLRSSSVIGSFPSFSFATFSAYGLSSSTLVVPMGAWSISGDVTLTDGS